MGSRLFLRPLPAAIAAAIAPLMTQAQDASLDAAGVAAAASMIEEVMIVGRLRSSADDLLSERIDQSYSADILGFEQIARIGDPDLATALRRVTGLTLIGGKYVYIRGLGERYSSTLLNGAAVPSPELSRNVIPLDLLPTNIVESVKVQKSYSADLPANFGGGSIDIRTKSIPEDLVFGISLGTGYETENNEDGLFYAGADEHNYLPAAIRGAINTYRGDLNLNNIAQSLNTDGGTISPENLAQAAQINRDLIGSLNRDVEISRDDINPDFDAELALGNRWDLGNDWSAGALVSLDHSDAARNRNEFRRGISFNAEADPNSQPFLDRQRTLEERKQTGALNLGVSYGDAHTLSTNSYYIRNTVADTSIDRINTPDRNITEGQGEITWTTRFEERELLVNQVLGTHEYDLEWDALEFLGPVSGRWYYSDAKARTSVPGAVEAQGIRRVDPATGATLSTELIRNNSMAQFSFLSLEDSVEGYGWDANLPIELGPTSFTVSGGFDFSEKVREYFQYTTRVSSANVPGNRTSALQGTPWQVLSDANIADPANNFLINLDTAFGQESYLAAQKNTAAFGMLDFNLGAAWKLSAGVRWEDFTQAILPVDVLDFNGSLNASLQEQLLDPNQRLAYKNDDYYSSGAITYLRPEFMDTSDFQVRFSYAETVVRPDLREVADAPYIDPENRIPVLGNPFLEFSDIAHYELRAEWYYDNSDNFTISLFRKEIDNPIEQSRISGSDDDIVLTFVNGLTGEVQGVEFEMLKDIAGGVFFSGNVTLSESEVEADPVAQQLTNSTHPLTGHSEYVINAQLAWDSSNNLFSASLVYNMFGERLFYSSLESAGGHGDAYEQPFNSLDLVASYYPTDQATLKLGIKNILDDNRVFKQTNQDGADVTILEQEIGASVGLDFSYNFF